MIDPNHPLPIIRQAKAVGISRGSVYYLPRPVSEEDLELMRRIDRLHLEHPFAGSRMLRDMLRLEGFKVGRTHVSTLMKRMGIEALYRKPRTTKPGKGHKVYPYLLRNLVIGFPNQVWAMDITYIPMARAFVGLMQEHDIRISMDGKNSWRDNVFVERLWRSVKYEDVYLRAYETVSAVRTGLNKYFDFYNSRRPHSSLDGRTPDQVYYDALPRTQAA